MSYVAAAVSLAGIGYGIYNSETQKAQAKKALKASKFNNYAITPELQGAYGRAEQMAKRGFTGAETAAFRQNKAQDINTQAQRALDIGGGNMARTISKLGTIANLGAENQFAAQDAALKRQNIHYADSLAQSIQQEKNRATGAGIDQYNRTQGAYGQAYAQNQTNENQLIRELPYLADTFFNTEKRNRTPDQINIYDYTGLSSGKVGGVSAPNSNYDYTAPQQDYYKAYQMSQYG